MKTSDTQEALDNQLVQASLYGGIPEIKAAIQQGADLYSNHGGVFWRCADSVEVIKYLISEGMDILKYGPDALDSSAGQEGCLEVTKFLIDEGILATMKRKEHPIHIACWYGNLEIVRYLLTKGGHLSDLDKYTRKHVTEFMTLSWEPEAKQEEYRILKEMLEKNPYVAYPEDAPIIATKKSTPKPKYKSTYKSRYRGMLG
jgi:ankyrin repeat protein